MSKDRSNPRVGVRSAVPAFAAACLMFALLPQAAQPAEDPCRARAQQGVDDLLRHYWVGSETNGHIVETWHGYPNALPDPRGALWERATLYLALDQADRTLNDPSLRRRLQADWRWTAARFTPQQLEACGADSGTNWAVDDAGWSALMYLCACRATDDRGALDRVRGLAAHAFDRWMDDRFGGGLWYSDERRTKSLYQAALLCAALRAAELAGDRALRDRALACYTWMETHLLRSDSLYWCDFGENGPVGQNRPDDVREADSVVFLGGNMAMGVLHARLFRETGDDTYRLRALRTAEALLGRLAGGGGVFINDRDAWTNGLFAGDWAREVLTLPGVTAKHTAVLRATADSIWRRARTEEGFYGGSWSGPAEGPESAWYAKGSKPRQIMTSASALNLLLAAAALENRP